MEYALVLYSYWRSSAAYRVRIALNLLGLDYGLLPVNLAGQVDEQHSSDYLSRNPQALVPTLLDGNRRFTQSMSIIEYLDETYGAPGQLVPADTRGRARVRALAQAIACDIHPLATLRVLNFLEEGLDAGATVRLAWSRHWIEVGFEALETMLREDDSTGDFCHGETPGLADICLVPQAWNARQAGVSLEAFPTIARIDANCRELEAFAAASPERQPDAPAG